MNKTRTVLIIIVALMLGFLIFYSQQHGGAIASNAGTESGGYGNEGGDESGGYGAEAEDESGGYGAEADDEAGGYGDEAGGSEGSGSGGEWVVADDGCRWFKKN